MKKIALSVVLLAAMHAGAQTLSMRQMVKLLAKTSYAEFNKALVKGKFAQKETSLIDGDALHGTRYYYSGRNIKNSVWVDILEKKVLAIQYNTQTDADYTTMVAAFEKAGFVAGNTTTAGNATTTVYKNEAQPQYALKVVTIQQNMPGSKEYSFRLSQ